MTTRSERANARAITALALRVYRRGQEHGPEWDDEGALDEQYKETIRLAGTGVFSRRALSAISNLTIARLRNRVPLPEDATGGIIEPSSLAAILELIEEEDKRDGAYRVSERSKTLTHGIVLGGTSLRMLSALSSVPVTTLRRWAA